MIQVRLICKVLGALLMILSLFMPTGIPFSIYYGDDDVVALLLATLITAVSGGAMWKLSGLGAGTQQFVNIRKRDGYVIVTLGWIIVTLFGSLPFVLHGSIPNYVDVFFETMSGFTTTGASVLNDIEALPHGILFWRSMTHWLGGMGIIVFALAILPLLGVGGAQLFGAEFSGATRDRIHPHVQGTAKRLWAIYVSLTILLTGCLLAGGMNLFDALCHAFSTMATGGFSTKQASIGHYDSAFIHYVIIVFMLLGGTNFTLHYYALRHGPMHYQRDEEFRFYIVFVSAAVLLVAVSVYIYTGQDVESSFRDGAFQVVAIVTSTGFVTADYESWTPYSRYVFFVLLFTGACAGSTTGGIKLVRILLVIKNGSQELKRLLHPRAIVPVRLNGRAVPAAVISNILAFFVLYILIFLVGALIMSFEPSFLESGDDFASALGSVAATLGCMGPGIGAVGPASNYAAISDGGKIFLSLLMLLGRLEIFTIIVFFSPAFWKA